MTNVLAIRPEPYKCKLGLFYDLNALSHNAKVVAFIASASGFIPRLVLKGGYGHPNIVHQVGTVDHFAISIGSSVTNPSIEPKVRDVATLYPGQSSVSHHWPSVGRVTEATIGGVAEALHIFDRPGILIAIKTSEDREGIEIGEIPEFLDAVTGQYGGRAQISGFQLNYGCVVEAPPTLTEFRSLIGALARDDILRRFHSRPVLSLGGSVLPPSLHNLRLPQCFLAELRIGEAVVAGSIPGERITMGLRKTSWLESRVLQMRKSKNGREQCLLVDVGTQILSSDRKSRPPSELIFESMGSEVSLVRKLVQPPNVMPPSVTLDLDYCEIERALQRFGGSSAQSMIRWSGPN